jgi:hypothetical protein
MNSALSLSAFATGDWLVVIDRLEASVFRSLTRGAMPQLIRSNGRYAETVSGPSPGTSQDVHEPSRLPGFFEPLAGVLHGARRILIFGRATTLGDEANAFILWLRGHAPEIAGRVVASVLVEPHQCSEDALLDRARAIYERAATGSYDATDQPETRP